MNTSSRRSARTQIASINPATNEVWKSFEPDAENAIEAKLQGAAAAFRTYRRRPLPDRARWMSAVGDVLDENKREFAELATREMGKPVRDAVQEVEKCARTCRYFAENAERFLAAQELPAESGRGFSCVMNRLGSCLP